MRSTAVVFLSLQHIYKYKHYRETEVVVVSDILKHTVGYVSCNNNVKLSMYVSWYHDVCDLGVTFAWDETS